MPRLLPPIRTPEELARREREFRRRFELARGSLPSYYPSYDKILERARLGWPQGRPTAKDEAFWRANELRAVNGELFASIRRYLKSKMTRQAPRRLYHR